MLPPSWKLSFRSQGSNEPVTILDMHKLWKYVSRNGLKLAGTSYLVLEYLISVYIKATTFSTVWRRGVVPGAPVSESPA